MASIVKSLWSRLRGESNNPEEDALPKPKNLTEALELLPKPLQEYRRSERPYRIAAYVAFVAIIIGVGVPMWWVTTEIPRAPIPAPPRENSLIEVQAKLLLAHTGKKSAAAAEELESFLGAFLADLSQTDPLRVDVEVELAGEKKLDVLMKDVEGSGLLTKDDEKSNNGVVLRIALVDVDQWPVFQGVNTYYGAGEWTLVKADLDEKNLTQSSTRLAHRIQTAVTDVLLDVNHLVSIVKRDRKQMPTPWEIAAMPPSHQKRIVWDGAALAPRYLVHVVHVHENGRSDGVKWGRYGEKLVADNIRAFAQLFNDVVDIKVSSEHLWDATPSWFAHKDVQARQAIDRNSLDNLLASVDSQLGPVDGEYPLFRIVVLDPKERTFLLDVHGDDTQGLAIASWGVVLDGWKDGEIRKDAWARLVAARGIAGLRVLLGIDAELPASSDKSGVPLAHWELQRLKLRAFVDDTSRATTSLHSLHRLLHEIPEMAVETDVAALVHEATRGVKKALKDGYTDEARRVVREARIAADAALFAPSLLASLYFPYEQRLAVYLPLALPALAPLITYIPTFLKYLIGWDG